jgi:NADPH:quinone reductase-like Zn-dependent oxidoreductase
MKALQFSTNGLPAILSIKEIPKPEPRKGEVLIQAKQPPSIPAT